MNNNTVIKLLLLIILIMICYNLFSRTRSIKSHEIENFNSNDKYPWEYNKNNFGNANILDDGEKGNAGLHFNLCSPLCCSPQYPLPFLLESDEMLCNNKDKFVPSTYTCSNTSQNAGCLCMTQDQADFLSKRGGNSF